eukprot:XP_028356722.1 oxysterol-binding protein 1 [Physeter catodon]
MAATELRGVVGPGPAAIAAPGGGGAGPPMVGGGGAGGRGDSGPGSGIAPGTVAAVAAGGPGPGAGGVAAAGPAPAPPAGGSGAGGSGSAREGWLFKWTNYIKGYQRRWFVLSNGLLSYYRSKAEMRHTCRGTINLATANITVEDSCNFIISNGGAQTYHLKASSEVERQRWVTALELAKAKAVKMLAESGREQRILCLGNILLAPLMHRSYFVPHCHGRLITNYLLDVSGFCSSGRISPGVLVFSWGQFCPKGDIWRRLRSGGANGI